MTHCYASDVNKEQNAGSPKITSYKSQQILINHIAALLRVLPSVAQTEPVLQLLKGATTNIISMLLRARSFLAFIVLFAIAPQLKGQDDNLPSKFLTGKDGLPQGYISGIAQDKVGFIWISTRNGLARYDGKKFKVFYHDTNDTSSLAGNIIKNIFIDSKDRLWIKYENAGLDVFNTRTEKVNHISNKPGLQAMKNIDIEAGGMSEDGEGNILFNTFNSGFIKLTVNNHSLQYPLKKIIAKDEVIAAIMQGKARHLFILTNKFLYHCNEKQQLVNKIVFTVPPSITKSSQNRYGIFFSSDSILLISGLNGIAKYQATHNVYKLIATLPSVNKMKGDSSYLLMFLNNKEGTCTFPNSSLSYTFETNSIADITALVDRSGVLWIGTNGYGVQMIHLHHNSFQYHKYKQSFTAFLIANYFDTNHSRVPENLTTADNIYGVRWTYDKTATLWMSNKSNSNSSDAMPVYAYTGQHFSLPHWHYKNGKKIKSAAVYGIAADSKNNLWVILGGYSISKLNPSTGIVQNFSPAVPFNTGGIDVSLVIDKQDNFWVACTFGLLHYREGEKSYKLYSLGSKNVADEEANHIINIAEDLHDENKLWMGSIGNGLICFNKKEKIFTAYTTKNGLPDNTIYSVMTDGKGYLWCSTNQGIFRFDTRTCKARKYTAENGAPDFEFNRFHHLRLPDGRFAFGGFQDYTVFDPLLLSDDTTQPNVAIVSFEINNKPADYREEGSPLPQAVNSLQQVRLNYLQNFLTFKYAALQYNQPDVFEYRYKLSGINNDWVYTGNNTLINYTALSPGAYTLYINAANAAGVWGSKVKELTIIIEPPWWKTWWFYTLVFIAALSVMYTIYRYRIHQVLKLERVRNRIAKDLHDEIGSTLSTISIYAKVVQQQLKNTGDDTHPLLTKISNNANQVQDAMNDIVWSINTKNDELENIINRMREHAIALFEAKDYTLHFSFDDTLNTIKLHMEQRKDFYLVYKEALNNIAKYADGKNVWISLIQNHHSITLTIKDDGKGFDATIHTNGGNGLHNMQSRALALKGEIKIISEKGSGTTVSLTIAK